MKIIVSKNHLLSKLRTVGKIVKGKDVAYSSFLFDINEGELTITGCDEAGQIMSKVDCEIKDAKEISFLVDSSMILNSLREVPEQPLTIDVEDNSEEITSIKLKIFYHNGRFEMQGSDPTVFPKMPDRLDVQAFTLTSKVLRKGLSLFKFAANDELRPVMSTVNLSCKKDVLAFAATSGHMLGMYEETDHNATDGIKVNIPWKIAKIVADLLQDDSDIDVNYDDRTIQFDVNGYSVRCRLFEGNYPNYRGVIPMNSSLAVKVHCADLIAAINRVSIFADESTALIKFELKGNNLILKSHSIDYAKGAKEDLFLDEVYEDFEIGFKSSFITEILKSVETENCIIKLNEPSKAALIVPEGVTNSTYLIMPMMIND